MRVTRVLTSFDGRINRRQYWLKGCLPIVGLSVMVPAGLALQAGLVLTLFFGLDGVLEGLENSEDLGILLIPLWIPFAIVLTLFQYAVFAKRWHDLGISGWWSAILFIPIVGSIVIIPLTIALGSIPGRKGVNKYGEQP